MNVFARGMPNQLLRLQEMHNGEKVQPTFSSGEMMRRQNAMRRILEELKLDAALLTSYHNICYFSDFLYCSFGRRYAFVLLNVSLFAKDASAQPTEAGELVASYARQMLASWSFSVVRPSARSAWLITPSVCSSTTQPVVRTSSEVQSGSSTSKSRKPAIRAGASEMT